MKDSFAQDDFVGGLEAGISEIGQRLKQHFPKESDDINELSDEVGTN